MVEFLQKRLNAAIPDLLREMVKSFAGALIAAKAETLCNAGYRQITSDRTHSRDGYRPRKWDTRAGTIDLAVPKLRSGSYFPDWLLERRRRAAAALISVVATSYLIGVSTRRRTSSSRISASARCRNARCRGWPPNSTSRSRRSAPDPWMPAGTRFVWADALTLKVREGGRAVNVHDLIAVGVNADGHREILGLDFTSAEDGAQSLLALTGFPSECWTQIWSPGPRAARPHRTDATLASDGTSIHRNTRTVRMSDPGSATAVTASDATCPRSPIASEAQMATRVTGKCSA